MFKKINKEKAMTLLNDLNSVALDIRDSQSFAEGHLDRFINMSQDQISTFVEKTPKGCPVLIMCYHGNSSQIVAEYLVMSGFTDVYSIDGGYEGWVRC